MSLKSAQMGFFKLKWDFEYLKKLSHLISHLFGFIYLSFLKNLKKIGNTDAI